MVELSLFPLNTVLFPGQPLKLHIFEERYKLMINECVRTNSPFGVVLIDEGSEAYGPLAKPYMVGSTAHITHIQRLPQDRMNILAIGRERFRIHQLYHEHAYLKGDVELFPMQDTSMERVKRGGLALRPLVEKYLTILRDAGQIQFDSSQIPHDPITLAYLSAIILQIDMREKQALLESSNTTLFIRRLLKHYHLEVMLLEKMVSPPNDTESDYPFSPN